MAPIMPPPNISPVPANSPMLISERELPFTTTFIIGLTLAGLLAAAHILACTLFVIHLPYWRRYRLRRRARQNQQQQQHQHQQQRPETGQRERPQTAESHETWLRTLFRAVRGCNTPSTTSSSSVSVASIPEPRPRDIATSSLPARPDPGLLALSESEWILRRVEFGRSTPSLPSGISSSDSMISGGIRVVREESAWETIRSVSSLRPSEIETIADNRDGMDDEERDEEMEALALEHGRFTASTVPSTPALTSAPTVPSTAPSTVPSTTPLNRPSAAMAAESEIGLSEEARRYQAHVREQRRRRLRLPLRSRRGGRERDDGLTLVPGYAVPGSLRETLQAFEKKVDGVAAWMVRHGI